MGRRQKVDALSPADFLYRCFDDVFLLLVAFSGVWISLTVPVAVETVGFVR